MPRRSLFPALLLVTAGLVAAACGGGGEPPPDDALAAEALGSGEDRPLPATNEPPRTPSTTPAQTPDAGTPEVTPRPTAESGTLDAGSPTNPDGPSAGTPGTYTVQAGDTLGDIAFRFRTTAAVLTELNTLENPDALTIGQVLVLPGGEPAPAEDEATVADSPNDSTDTNAANDGAAGDAGGGGVTVPPPPPAGTPGAGTSPAGIPQPGPDVTTDTTPDRPAALADFAVTAMPWLQGRTTPSEIEPLLVEWSMPPVEGDRFFLVDTDADGLFSLIVIFTDPATDPAHGPFTDANLVVYDPLPENPTRWRLAYDHNLANALVGQDYSVLDVSDVTGDNKRDITYAETFCGASTCTTSLHVLVRDGDGYRDAVVTPIDIPTVTSIALRDETGDGVRDIVIEGGTFGTVGAGPPRPFEFVFAAIADTIQEVRRTGLPTSFLVWVLIDGNSAFDRGDFAAAVSHYTQAATDLSLDEFIPGTGGDLRALAQLRLALIGARTGDATAALAAAQAAAAGSGLVAELSTPFFAALAADGALPAACGAFNQALTLRLGDWDAFWSQFGFGLGKFRAETICPFEPRPAGA